MAEACAALLGGGTVSGIMREWTKLELTPPQQDRRGTAWCPDECGCQRRDRNPGARGTGPGSYAATGCGAASLRNAAARPNVSPRV